MPFLAALVGSALSGLVAFLAQYVTKRVAVGVALAAFLVAGWIALQATLTAVFTAIAYTAPGWMVGPLGVVAYLLPANFAACTNAIMSAYFARWVWDAQREWAKAVAT